MNERRASEDDEQLRRMVERENDRAEADYYGDVLEQRPIRFAESRPDREGE